MEFGVKYYFDLRWGLESRLVLMQKLLFNHSVVSDASQSRGLQHARLLYPSQSPRACSNSCPLSQWCHPTDLTSVVPFSSCLRSFPASESFPMSRLFASGGQSSIASASASVPPITIQNWFPLGLSGLISLQSKGLSNTTVQKHQFFRTQPSLWSNSHIHTWLLEKTIALTRWTFVGKVMFLLFNMRSRFVIAFLPRSKHLLISWLQSPSPVILEPKKVMSVIVSPSICYEVIIFQNGSLEGYALNFSFKNTKITMTCLTTIDRRMLDPTKKIPRVQGQRRNPNNMVGGEHYI